MKDSDPAGKIICKQMLLDIATGTQQTQEIEQKQELKQSVFQDTEGAKPSRFIWTSSHGPKCTCKECRTYYTVQNGEVKKKESRIVPLDKHKTLDTCEYIENKKVNKFRDAMKWINYDDK